MSLMGKLLATSLANPDDFLIKWFGGGPSMTGLSVTSESAERVTAVFRAVRLIAQTVASLPLLLY